MPYIALIIILGLLIGSFTNVVIYRLPREESIVFPPSHCPYCEKQLKAIDLIPLLSYLFLRGRCRYCGEKISPRYLLVEVLTSLLFLLVYLKWGLSIETIGGLILTFILISSAFIDIDHGIIPDKLTYPGFVTGIILSFFTVGISSALLGVLFFAGILLLAAVLSKGGMGGGDIKLAAVIGVFAGLKGAVVAFVLSALLGGIFVFVLLLLGRVSRKTKIKFGPFLAGGAYLAYNYAAEISTWYLGLFVV